MAKSDNLLAIIWLLRSRGRMTAEQLAETLETSVRTVYRYIDTLCASGVPIIAEAGHDGGYSLLEGFRSTPIFFSPTELKGLFHAARLVEHSGYPFVDELRTALTKLAHNLTEGQISQLERSAAAISVVPAPRGGPVEPWLPPLEQAVADQVTIRFSYRKPESAAPDERRVDPYAIAHSRGLWYLVAFCHERQAMRDFRVDRIAGVTLTEERFNRPESFSLYEHFNGPVLAQVKQGPHTIVTVTGDATAIAALCDHWYLSFCVQERGQNEATFRLDPMGYQDLPEMLLPYGPSISVTTPDELSRRLAALARSWAEHHEQKTQLP